MNDRILLSREPVVEGAAGAGSFLRANAGALALAAIGFILLFRQTIGGLVSAWAEDPDFSHGFLVVPISSLILFADRKRLASLPVRRSWMGLALLLGSLGVFFAGGYTVSDWLERIGLYGSLLGGIWYLLGSGVIRANPFPYFFLLFAIPPPGLLLNPLRLALRQFATQLTSEVLLRIGLVAIPEGNVLSLGEHKLEVADACSGIRSLLAILAVAVLFAYLFRTGLWKGILLTATAVPVTIFNNVLRIVVVAVALGRFQVDLAEGTAHDLLSLATFTLSVGGLYLSSIFYNWLFRVPERPSP
jgi:exosortase